MSDTALIDAPPIRDEQPSLRKLLLLSLAVLVAGFGGCVTWAALASIDTAVPASGFVVAAGKRKTVNLSDAGTLRELLVREGSTVKAGQVLLRLDDVQSRSVLEQARALYFTNLARVARLDAEIADSHTLSFPPALDAAADDAMVAHAVAAERQLFATRWDAFDAGVRVDSHRLEEHRAEAASLHAQRTSTQTRLDLVREELRGVTALLAKGYETRPHWLELRRLEAELSGALGDIEGKLSQVEQAIAEAQADMGRLRDERHAQSSKDRADAQAAIADAAERVRASADLHDKRELVAPEDGVVTDVRFFTQGASIGAGQPVLDLVPAGGDVEIEGALSPLDIERVQVGQPVNVRLTAYKQHKVPVLVGRLTYVSADRKQDDKGESAFTVRAVLAPDALARLPNVKLLPGMPAELLIIAGRRTVLDFLVSPIRDGMRNALSEE